VKAIVVGPTPLTPSEPLAEPGASRRAAAEEALLVHGNDLCAGFYLPLAEALARRGFRTALITLPGFHREPPHDPPSLGALVDDVVGALAAHVPAGGTLIGHSLGGLLAFLAAARRPPEVRRLVLLEPAIAPLALLARIAGRKYAREVVGGDRETFSNWSGMFFRVADPAAYPRAAIDLYLEVRRTSDRATQAAIFRDLPSIYPLPFAAVPVPTLLLRGAATGWRARVATAFLARRLRHVTVDVVPGAAHWIANERDEEAARRIAEFVPGPGPAAGRSWPDPI